MDGGTQKNFEYGLLSNIKSWSAIPTICETRNIFESVASTLFQLFQVTLCPAPAGSSQPLSNQSTLVAPGNLFRTISDSVECDVLQ